MKSIIFFISIVTVFGCSNSETTNLNDENLNCDSAIVNTLFKQLAGYNSAKFDDKYTGVVESHFTDNPNQLEWTLHYENGLITKHEIFYQNGNKKFVEPVRCNSRHGLHLTYNKKGILVEESNYHLGKREGLSKGYYHNGNLQRTVNFKNNLKHGKQYEFNQQGDSTEMGLFKKGVMIEKRTITHK